MYYLKCKHCGHLNEVKSEYLVVCGLCNRKLDDNFKEWQKCNPSRSFDDFKREVCLSEDQVRKGDTAKSSKKRMSRKAMIAGLIGGVLGMLLVISMGIEFSKMKGKMSNQASVPVTEQQWYTGTYEGGISLSTPKALGATGALMKNLPEEVKKLVKTMNGYTYRGDGVEFMLMFAEYTPEVGQVDLEEAAEGGLSELKDERGVFDLRNDKAYIELGGMRGVVMQGTYVKGGIEYEFNSTVYVDGVKYYQLFSTNKKGDDVARGIVRRINDSFQVLGHEESKSE